MYYVLKCQDPDQGYIARVEYRDDDPFRFWNTGECFDEPLEIPLRATVLSDPQTVLPELWETPLPMMTVRLYEALSWLGVRNLDVYPVELVDGRSGRLIDGYLAFNLIGAIAATDSLRTQYAPDTTERMSSADIDHLAIDPARTQGARMFRLAESVSAIVVCSTLKDGLEAAGFNTLSFLSDADWVS